MQSLRNKLSGNQSRSQTLPTPSPVLNAKAKEPTDAWWDSERPEPQKLRTMQTR